MDSRPTIVPADICPQLEAVELDADADDDAYTVQRIAPATWSATYRHHRALGGDERQATDRLEALLRGEGIESVVLDAHTSILEGSIGAIPRRLMVTSEDGPQAVLILKTAGFDYDPRNN